MIPHANRIYIYIYIYYRDTERERESSLGFSGRQMTPPTGPLDLCTSTLTTSVGAPACKLNYQATLNRKSTKKNSVARGKFRVPQVENWTTIKYYNTHMFLPQLHPITGGPSLCCGDLSLYESGYRYVRPIIGDFE